LSAATETAHAADRGAADGVRSVARNGAALLLAYVLPRLFTFGAVIVAARVLGAERFGAYGTAAAFAVVASIVATLGMGPLLIRDMARDPARAAGLLRSAHIIKAVTNLLMLATLLGGATVVLHYPAPVVPRPLLRGHA
jgi:O-antigen/teichoic acid export membrane protein